MKILLIKDVPNLGQTGEVKDVKPGYARNFLIRQNFAVLPGDPQALQMEAQKAEKAKVAKAKQIEVKEKIHDLEAKKIIFKVKVNKKGHPFKAIRGEQIAKELNIEPGRIKTDPIKSLGEHEVTIKDGDEEAKITVVVASEK